MDVQEILQKIGEIDTVVESVDVKFRREDGEGGRTRYTVTFELNERPPTAQEKARAAAAEATQREKRERDRSSHVNGAQVFHSMLKEAYDRGFAAATRGDPPGDGEIRADTQS